MIQDHGTLELGFYRGVSLVSRLIRWQTRSPYSHVAGRWTGSGRVIEAWHLPMPRGCVYCREGWDEGHTPGTVIDVCRLQDLHYVDALAAWQFACDQIGKRYAFREVFRFISRRRTSQDDRWFCSELWAAALEQAGVRLLRGIPPAAVSPGILALSPRLIQFGVHVVQTVGR